MRGNPNWKPGVSGNPSGRPAGIFHNYTVVAEQLLESFSVNDLKAMALNHEEAEKAGLKPFQIAVLGRISNLFDTIDKRLASDEMERLLDRTIGKPLSKTEITGKDGQNFVVTIKGLESLPVKEGEFKEVLPVGADAPRFEGDVAALLPVLDNEQDGN